jgi:EAL domain-containing protein (putative c-di-GMP-specific phosphodiesterase class I)
MTRGKRHHMTSIAMLERTESDTLPRRAFVSAPAAPARPAAPRAVGRVAAFRLRARARLRPAAAPFECTAIRTGLRVVDDARVRVMYQPIVAGHGQILGFEALARCTAGPYENASTTEFVAAVEAAGGAAELTRVVINEICRQVVRWRLQKGCETRVSMNVTAGELRSGLCESLVATLAGYGLAPDWLTLEITESQPIRLLNMACAEIALLRRHGVRIAIDDFGTGYSSFHRLLEIRADDVKLDKSMVDAVPGDRNAEAVVRTVVSLANRMGLRVVAEGVERSAQHHWLVACGVDAFQGYLFHRAAGGESWAWRSGDDGRDAIGPSVS